MAQLINCRACGKPVSGDARACPHCGEPDFSRAPGQVRHKADDEGARAGLRALAYTAVVVLGVVGFSLMVLFPPGVEERWQMQMLLYWPGRGELLEKHFDGYHYLF